jgi:hypothetical protein
MELFLNIIHYCIYKADSKRHLLSSKLNPFVLVGRIPAIKRKFEEQNTTLLGVVNKYWSDKRYGSSIMTSGGGIVVCLSFVVWGIATTTASFFDTYFHVELVHVIVYGVASYMICHYTIFKDDKYLRYFKRFEKWSKADKWIYGLLTFTFIAASIVFWIYSWKFHPTATPNYRSPYTYEKPHSGRVGLRE